MGYIYKITNNTNQKIYIGQTKQKPADRYAKHRYLAIHPDKEKGVSYLHRAMASDGLDNFSFEIVEQIENEQLNEREQYWIKYYGSLIPDGYNITEGGAGTVGYSRPQSEEEKRRRKIANKQYYIDHPEAREQLRERTTTFWQNDEYRKKVTEGNKKFYAEHPDIFRGANNPFYGKHHTEESLKKMKEASKDRQIKIARLDKDTLEILEIYDGIREAENKLGVSHGWISKAARQDKIAYGYRWKII